MNDFRILSGCESSFVFSKADQIGGMQSDLLKSQNTNGALILILIGLGLTIVVGAAIYKSRIHHMQLVISTVSKENNPPL